MPSQCSHTVVAPLKLCAAVFYHSGELIRGCLTVGGKMKVCGEHAFGLGCIDRIGVAESVYDIRI